MMAPKMAVIIELYIAEASPFYFWILIAFFPKKSDNMGTE